MAVLFCDGFDYYGTSDIVKMWDVVANFQSDTNARSGGRCISTTTNSHQLSKMIAQTSTIYLGVAVRPNSTYPYDSSFFSFRDGSVAHIYLYITPSLTIKVHACGSQIGICSRGLTIGQWDYLEMGAYIHDTQGWVEVRLNGETVFYAGPRDTKNSSNAWANQICTASDTFGSLSFSLDDLYVSNSSFLGDIKVAALKPTSDVTVQWSNSVAGQPNYTSVDEAVLDLNDYVYTDVVGATDVYGYEDLGASAGTIYAVAVTPCLTLSEAGSHRLSTVAQLGSNTVTAGSLYPSTSAAFYQGIFNVAPDGQPWTRSKVNDALFGIRLEE